MTDETIKLIVALGIPGIVAGYAVRGLVTFGKHIIDDTIDARIKVREAEKGREEFKARWKTSVIEKRDMRRAEEALLTGKPSVPPLSLEEPTGAFEIDEAADQEWRRQSEERRVQMRREQEAELERYNREMKSPSPDPTKPLPRPPRPYRK